MAKNLMDITEFNRRRCELMQRMSVDSVAVIPTAPTRTRNRDVEYPFRPSSDFHYLTGFPEPEAVAVLIPNRESGEYLLFCRERDLKTEQWSGTRTGLEGAMDLYGADQAFAIDTLDIVLPKLMQHCDCVYYSFGFDAEFDQRMLAFHTQIRERLRRDSMTVSQFISVDRLLHPMRLIKSTAELHTMEQAGKISSRAHTRAMRHCRPGRYEYQLEAELIHEFQYAGVRNLAYPAIVAGGFNACILHYTDNNAKLVDGDLLLIDAGCELDGYAADITRTFPVNGRFSAAQRDLYTVVLEAQQSAIDQVRCGRTWEDIHQAALRILVRGLLDFGLLSGSLEQALATESYKAYYMHRTGHWLGLDVHDVGDYRIQGRWQELQPNMVLTVEPGLYVGNDAAIPEPYRGIGIRIEDDVVVTEGKPFVLTDDVVKAVDAVEALVGSD